MHLTVFENKDCLWRYWPVSHFFEVYLKLWMGGSYRGTMK